MGRRKFSAEYKREAVKLVFEQGMSVAKAASELGIGASTLDNWVRAHRKSQSGTEQVTESERAELKRLRKEVQRLRMQRDILKKATAFFANHSE